MAYKKWFRELGKPKPKPAEPEQPPVNRLGEAIKKAEKTLKKEEGGITMVQPSRLEQLTDRAERLIHPEQIAYTDEELADFLDQEVRILEEARANRDKAEKRKKATTLLTALVAKGKEAKGEEKAAIDSLAAKLREYFAAKGETPEPTSEPDPRQG